MNYHTTQRMQRVIFYYFLLIILFSDAHGQQLDNIISSINKKFSKDPNSLLIASLQNISEVKKTFHNPSIINSQKKSKNIFSFQKSKILISDSIVDNNKQSVTDTISTLAIEHQIDPNLIKAIITNESNFEPLSFNINVLNENGITMLNQIKEIYPETKITTYERWGKKFASLKLENSSENMEKAKYIFDFLRNNAINFDSSYMQINSQHYDRLSLSSINIFDIRSNIEAGIKIYKECENRYNRDLLKSIECYNKGTFKGQTSYFDRVYKTYTNLSAISMPQEKYDIISF